MREELILSICDMVSDYRENDIDYFNYEHVARWVDQFNIQDQIPLLSEMNHILQRNYISRNNAIEFIKSILNSGEGGVDIQANYYNINFLNIQRNGSSQDELLELVQQVLDKEYELSFENCGISPSKYIYIDDCLFSGNTMLHDIKEWVINENIENTELVFYFFGVYSNGEYYINNRLKPFLDEKNIKYTIFRLKTFENRPWEKDTFQCCWPDPISGYKDLDAYILELKEYNEQKGWKEPRTFYPGTESFEEKLFSSIENRIIVENALLLAGLEIRSFCHNPKRTMRPLGFDALESLGFGSMFVTYRNIANNCPLALWWGDPNATSPLNRWYPLFPRKVNSAILVSPCYFIYRIEGIL